MSDALVAYSKLGVTHGDPMELNVRGLHLPVPSALAQRVRHRLDLSLGRFAPRIRSVDVRLEDVNA